MAIYSGGKVICDIHNLISSGALVEKGEGYILTTRQVVTSERHWKYIAEYMDAHNSSMNLNKADREIVLEGILNPSVYACS